MNKLMRLSSFRKSIVLLAFTLLASVVQAQDQPTTPATPLQEVFNQYTKLVLNTTNGITSYKDNTLVNNGTMKTFTEFIYEGEVDHYAATLIPIDNYSTAELDFSLELDGVAYTIQIGSGGQLTLPSGATPYTETIDADDVIIIGYDDLQVIYKVNDQILHTEAIATVPEVAKAILNPINATDASFYFFFDVDFRNAVSLVNFVEDASIIQEGDAVELCVDLTTLNTTPDQITVTIQINDPKSPHFSSFVSEDVTIGNAASGSFCINVPSELPNAMKDDVRRYEFEIIAVNGMNVGIGERRIHKVTIIDDFVPFDNNLAPGDLIFTGFETDIGGEEDQIIFTNLVPLTSGTSFQLTNANYSSNTNFFGLGFQVGFSSVQFIYTGETGLPVNTIFCVYTGYNPSLPGTNINRIEINGVDETSLFTIENKGFSDAPIINLSSSESKSLFLVQGQWGFARRLGRLNGKVLSGIHVGGFWSVDENPPSNTSNEHPDLECLGIQGPTTADSYWAYYQCETPYNQITTYDLRKHISDFGNWVSGLGDDEVNWPEDVDVCTSTCAPVEAYADLEINVEDLSVVCDGSSDPNGEIAAWLDDQLANSVTGGCYGIEVSHNFLPIAQGTCNTYTITFVVTDGCSNTVSDEAILSVIDAMAPIITNVDPYIERQCFEEFMASDVIATDECGEVSVELLSEEYLGGTFGVDRLIRKTFIATDACGNTSTAVQEQLLDQTQDGFTVLIGDGSSEPLNGEITICEGDNKLLTPGILGAEGSVYGRWKQAGESDDTSIASFEAQGSYSSNISIRLTDSRGCQASDEVSLIVPDLEVTINADEYYFICDYDQQDISLTSTLSGFGSNVSYQWWDNNSGQTIGDSPTYTREYGSNYNDISLFVTDDESNCVAESTNRVGFEDIAETVTISGPSVICQPGEVVLTSNSTENTYSNKAFQWYKDSGSGYSIMHNEEDENLITTVTGNTTYKVEVTYDSGCVFSEEFTVFVEDVSLLLSSSTTLACSPDEVVEIETALSGSSLNGQYAWTYSYGGASFPLALTTPTINVSLSQATNYTCTYTSDDGCTAEASIQIMVDDENPQFECPADLTINLNGECVYVVPNYSTTAVDDNCGISSVDVDQMFVGFVFEPQVFTVQLNAYDYFGNSDFCDFTVTLEPAFATFPDDITIDCAQNCCAGSTGVPTSDIEDVTITYSDNVNVCEGQPNGSKVYAETRGDDIPSCNYCGTFTRTWTVSLPNQCYIERDQTITVIDNEPPDIVVDDVTICSSEYSPTTDYSSSLIVSDNCTSQSEIIVDPEYNNDGIISPGVYSRFYTATDKCGNMSSWQQVITTVNCNSKYDETSEVRSSNQDFRIHPNPASSYVNLEYKSEKEDKASLLIYKTSGELLSVTSMDIFEGLNTKQINTADYVSGMYFVRLQTSGKEFIEKLIIVQN